MTGVGRGRFGSQRYFPRRASTASGRYVPSRLVARGIALASAVMVCNYSGVDQSATLINSANSLTNVLMVTPSTLPGPRK